MVLGSRFSTPDTRFPISGRAWQNAPVSRALPAEPYTNPSSTDLPIFPISNRKSPMSRLPVELPGNDVQAGQHRDHVAQELALGHRRKGLVVVQARGTHAHPPRPLRAVAHQVPAQLAVRRLGGRVDLAR